MVETIKEGIVISRDNLVELDQKLSLVFSEIKDEFQDHLESINENTNEIQWNYAYLCELDNKIAKLNERIDDIHMILSNLTGKKIKKMSKFEDIDPLTEKEKVVFLNLYSEEQPVSYHELARKMSMPISLTRQYVLNLIEKGVPVQKIYKKTRPYVLLDPKFKNLQAKQNILKIEQRILV